MTACTAEKALSRRGRCLFTGVKCDIWKLKGGGENRETQMVVCPDLWPLSQRGFEKHVVCVGVCVCVVCVCGVCVCVCVFVCVVFSGMPAVAVVCVGCLVLSDRLCAVCVLCLRSLMLW